MTNDAFQARFTLKAVQVRSTGTEKGDRNRDRIDTVILTINGTQLVDRIIQAEADFIWRTDDRDLDCSLVLKSSGEVIASSSYGGTIWSLCRLFEGTTIIGTDQGRLVTWTFPETDVKVEFLLTTHEEVEPFFIRGSAFRQFSLPAGVF